MKDVLFKIGNITVHGYGTMIAIGIILAYAIFENRAKKRNLNPDDAFSLTLCGVLGGALGAKLLYYIVEIKSIIANPKLLLNFTNGFVVYGGIIGGCLTVLLFCRIKKLNILQWFDLIIPEVAIAQGFGRLGCFMAGCCYGAETDGWLHIIFKESAFAPNGVPLIPTQLISSFLNFANFAILVFVLPRLSKKSGTALGGYLIMYSIGRFILEFFRGDLERGQVGSLSTSQFISIFILIAGVVVIVLCQKLSAVPVPVDVTHTEEAEKDTASSEIE